MKSYNLDCPVARTLDIIGERWSLLILRDLFRFGPRKFQDFEESLNGVPPNTLSSRLKKMEQQRVIERCLYNETPQRYEYCLTPKGEALRIVMKSLYEWGEENAKP